MEETHNVCSHVTCSDVGTGRAETLIDHIRMCELSSQTPHAEFHAFKRLCTSKAGTKKIARAHIHARAKQNKNKTNQQNMQPISVTYSHAGLEEVTSNNLTCPVLPESVASRKELKRAPGGASA